MLSGSPHHASLTAKSLSLVPAVRVHSRTLAQPSAPFCCATRLSRITAGCRFKAVPEWTPRTLRAALVATFLVLLLSACGAHKRTAVRVASGKYGDYGAQTVTVAAGNASSHLCKDDANGFAGQAHSLVVHYGSTAASSTDVYYMGLRQELGDFEARRCDATLLGEALARQLTAKQRRLLLAELPGSMAGRVRAALDSA